MADFRAIFGDDDSETEEFLGFDLDDIKEAEDEENKPLQKAGSAIQCRYLITPKDVIGAE
jgi:hypothetical protein